MLTLLKRVSRVEWLAIAGAVFLGIVVYHFINKYDELSATVVTAKEREQQAMVDLVEEQRSTAITDTVVFEYSLERELKRDLITQLRYETPSKYFQVRDQSKPEEIHDVSRPTNPSDATENHTTTKREVDTRPTPAAIAALVTGMWDTYHIATDSSGAHAP